MINKLLLITWNSGVGKTSLGTQLKKKGFVQPYSYTTRERRWDEELDQYIFLTTEQFIQFKEDWRLAEWVEYNGNYYWASSYWYWKLSYLIVEPIWRDILIKVAKDWKLRNSNWELIEVEVKTVYLELNKDDQLKRLTKRGDSIEQVEKRLKDNFQPTPDCLILDATLSPEELANKINEQV